MVQKKTKVGVVIPTYNRAEYVKEAIHSVIHQTFKNWKLIVVDDASTDNTRNVIKEIDDSRVHYIRNEKNKGAQKARNRGVLSSKTKYIAFLDSDDIWHKEKLKKQVNKAEKECLNLVSCSELILGEKKTLRESYNGNRNNISKEIMKRDIIGSCSKVLVKRSTIIEAGMFDTRLKYHQDWDMWIRISELGGVGFVDSVLVKKRVGHDNISSNLQEKIKSEEYLYKKYMKKLRKNKEALKIRQSALSKLKYNYSFKEGAKMAIKSLKHDPFQPSLIIATVIAMFGTDIYNSVYLVWNRLKGRDYKMEPEK